MNNFETIHFDKICRTCLSEENEVMRSVYSIDESMGETIRLFEMLMSCAAVQVLENDGLPSQVCLQCVHYITRAFSFKQLCERSDTTLRQLLCKPIQETYMELKPLMINESHVPSFSDVINTVNENIQQVNAITEALNQPSDGLTLTSIQLDEPYKEHVAQDDDLKLECRENTITLERENAQEEKKDSTKKDLKKRKSKDDTEQPIYPCEACTQCFTTVTDLKAHAKAHSRKTGHICRICSQGFASASTLCRHMKVHDGAKRHLCSDCGKGFARSDDLTRHIRTHTGEKPFPCKLCGKSFAQSFRLLEHMRAHANEKSFICSICGKAFSRYTSLAAHNKTHSGIKSHACGVCGKSILNVDVDNKRYKCPVTDTR